MKHLLVLLFLYSFFTSCKETFKKESKFDLNSNYFDFSKKMENGDSMELFVDLSACLSKSSSISYLFKKNNQIYISTKFETDDLKKTIQEFEPILYSDIKNDSLNFESYFTYLHNKNKIAKPVSAASIVISYKADTLAFNSRNLNEHIKSIDYFLKILKRVHPTIKL